MKQMAKIKFKTSTLKTCFCDDSDAYIHARELHQSKQIHHQ